MLQRYGQPTGRRTAEVQVSSGDNPISPLVSVTTKTGRTEVSQPGINDRDKAHFRQALKTLTEEQPVITPVAGKG